MRKRAPRLHRRADEGGAPMRTEPRLIFAASIDVGNDLHLVTVDAAFEDGRFVDRESHAGVVVTGGVFIEVQERAQLGIAATIGAPNLDAPARILDLLCCYDVGFAEGQLIRTVADALVAEPIAFWRPVTESMAAGRALDRLDALDGALPASAKDRRQYRLRRHPRHIDWRHGDWRRRRGRRRRNVLLLRRLLRNLHLGIRGGLRGVGTRGRGGGAGGGTVFCRGGGCGNCISGFEGAWGA